MLLLLPALLLSSPISPDSGRSGRLSPDTKTGKQTDDGLQSEMPQMLRAADPTTDDEGFVLAMRFADASQFSYASELWTNDDLVDEDDQSATKNADGKFDPFVSKVAGQIKGCLLKEGTTETQGCVTYTLPKPTTLQNLFDTTDPNTVNFEVVNGRKNYLTSWEQIVGDTFDIDNPFDNPNQCQANPKASRPCTNYRLAGINVKNPDSGGKSRVRFGAMFNNERNFGTPDDAIGFGAVESCGSQVGAGAVAWSKKCPANLKRTWPRQGTIWIKEPCQTCTSVGDPHFVSFNGDHYDHQGHYDH